MLFNFILTRLFQQKTVWIEPFRDFFKIRNFLMPDSLIIWLFFHWFHKNARILHKIAKIWDFFRDWLYKYTVILLIMDKPHSFSKLHPKYVNFLASVSLKRTITLLKISLFWCHFWQLNFWNMRFVCVCDCLHKYMIIPKNQLYSNLFKIRVVKI